MAKRRRILFHGDGYTCRRLTGGKSTPSLPRYWVLSAREGSERRIAPEAQERDLKKLEDGAVDICSP